jgi:hypothetical protein
MAHLGEPCFCQETPYSKNRERGTRQTDQERPNAQQTSADALDG